MGRRKILVVENALAMTGGTVSILRSAVSLRDQFDFEFLFPTESKARDAVSAMGFVVHVLPMKELRKGFVALLTYVPALVINTVRFFRLLRKVQPALVVSNDVYNLIPPLYRMLGGRTKYVVFIRFMPSKFNRLLFGAWSFLHYVFASSTIAVSAAVKSEMPYQGKVVVIGGELPDDSPTLETRESEIMVFVGNYIQGKGQDLALKSFATIHQLYPTWQLQFHGSDMGVEKNRRYKKSLQELSNTLGISNRVTLLDFAHDISQAYLPAAFVLNFSESESFSMTTLEAQFYGRPVIVTRCGGPEEIIVDGVSGMLVPVGDTAAMSKAMEYMITHREERRKMGIYAFHHVREKFSRDNTIGKLGALFESLIR